MRKKMGCNKDRWWVPHFDSLGQAHSPSEAHSLSRSDQCSPTPRTVVSSLLEELAPRQGF